MSKNSKILVGIAITAVVLWGGLAAYRNREASVPGTIKIGVLYIASGDGAAWGESAKRGIDLAIEEFRAGSREMEVEVVYEDTGGEAKRAVSAYQKLVNVDQADVILGPLFQTEVAVVAPLVVQGTIPVIAPSYAPIKNRPDPRNPLLIWMDATVEAQRMAEYVYTQGIRRIGILGTKDPWENEVSDAFAEKLTSLGGTVVAREIIQQDSADTKLPITKIVNAKPDALFLGTYYQFVSGLKTAKDMRFNGKIYGIEVDSYLAD